MKTTRRPRVVVLGGGYAGTMAANRIAGAGTEPAPDVVLVNPRPRFVHRIRLHQWATGTGEAEHDFDQVLGPDVRLVVDSAARIDVAGGRVELAGGDTLDYDQLVYAVGSTALSANTIPGAEEHGYPIGEWEAAERLRARLAEVAEDASITVIGGGLTGIEMAAELADAGRSVRLVCRGVLAPSFGNRSRRIARRRLTKLGVEILENHRVHSIGADTVTVSAGESTAILPSATTVVATGFGTPDLAAKSGLTIDAIGRLVTDETLTSVDDPRIVGAGDSVAPSGQSFRMSCQAANQLGPHAGDTVRARLAGTQPKPVALAFLGQCTSLGRHAAVVQPTRRDDTPVEAAISGRTAAAIKELVCRSVILGLRFEGRHPGATPSFGRPRDAAEPARLEAAG
ncbi:FAD-dependent oxidoreductase [Gordonia sp. LSe1-13]|uniref:FAD-dependent oxidoreductase n=1 Tax=Gordonia sesuvii TaxID=3116777 RepID=A0ABU7MH67_9ACTN|nr:FAD-dependent oxidoreductase [Gordonia sp. LSe1-13]